MEEELESEITTNTESQEALSTLRWGMLLLFVAVSAVLCIAAVVSAVSR